MNVIKGRAALATLAVVDAVALVGLLPDWARLARDARAPHAWVARIGADGVATALCAAALWLVAAWLGVGLLAAAASALPGACGHLGRKVARGLLPAVVFRVVAGAVGLSILAAPVAAGARTTAGHSGTVTAGHSGTIGSGHFGTAASVPGWPTDGTAGPPVRIGWPTMPTVPTPAPPTDPAHTTPAPTHPVPTQTTTQHDDTVTVRPGDSLWLIAAHRLGGDPSAEQIAAAWPRWYQANRAEIGADPNVLHPGQVLHAPADPAPQHTAQQHTTPQNTSSQRSAS